MEGAWPSSTVPAGRIEPIRRPGAMISGLEIPSCVLPLDENDATVVWPGTVVSVAPTVITNGSLAGAYDVVPGPLLPDGDDDDDAGAARASRRPRRAGS